MYMQYLNMSLGPGYNLLQSDILVRYSDQAEMDDGSEAYKYILTLLKGVDCN